MSHKLTLNFISIRSASDDNWGCISLALRACSLLTAVKAHTRTYTHHSDTMSDHCVGHTLSHKKWL